MPDYAAYIETGGSIFCESNPVYNVGEGDFTITALVQTTTGGTIISRIDSTTGVGFALSVNPSEAVPNGVISLYISDGNTTYEVNSVANPDNIFIFDGLWHHVAIQRLSGNYYMYLDGHFLAYSANATSLTTLDINNSSRLLMGNSEKAEEPFGQLVGGIEDVTFWNRALSVEELMLTKCDCIKGNEPGLIGYWAMNDSLEDLSPTKNNGQSSGQVFCYQIFHSNCCYGDNNYCYVSIANDGGLDDEITKSQAFTIKDKTPVLTATVVTSFEDFTFPEGLVMTIEDPNGNIYSEDQNTERVCVKTQDGSISFLTILKPISGNWRINVVSPGNTTFQVSLQTIPNKNIPETIQNVLEPIYGPCTVPPEHLILGSQFSQRSWSGWNWAAAASLTIGVALLIVTAEVASAGALTPAIVGGLAVVTALDVMVLRVAAENIELDASPHHYTQTASNMAQFNTLDSVIICGDSYSDSFTESLYDGRADLYSRMANTPFKRVGLKNKGNKRKKAFKSEVINEELQKPGVRFFTSSSHGQYDFIRDATDDMATNKALKIRDYPEPVAKAIAGGKIFHLLACRAGRDLGKDLVKNGATAFFGYSEPFQATAGNQLHKFIECDSQVGISLIEGKTAGEAKADTIEKFNKLIEEYEPELNNLPDDKRETSTFHYSLVRLRQNIACFVGPSTDSEDYGKVDARIIL